MNRIFLTGATGVLGRRTLPRLVDAGHQVTAVARSGAKATEITDTGATAADIDLFDGDAVPVDRWKDLG